MPYLHNYRLFISHAWRYSDGYARVIRFLNDASNFSYTNYSVPESKAFTGLNSNQLGDQLVAQMRPVQCVIILAGMYVAHSGWIQYEIDRAIEMKKPIVGIVPWGQERTPTAVSNAAHTMVAWQSSSIVDAIRRVTP